MITAALTGGIATGKSYCLARFQALGAEVVDADRLARDAVAPGTPGLEAIVERFGSPVLLPDGTLDRAALGRIVFADRTARLDLEGIVHPQVYRGITAWVANLPPGTRVAVADIPLLLETGHRYEFDRVIVAACAPAEQLRRVMARDGLSEEEARARLEAQWPIEEKVRRADFVVRTDVSFEDTDTQVRRVYERLLAEAEARP
jgi:dephospho-CoA kinase